LFRPGGLHHGHRIDPGASEECLSEWVHSPIDSLINLPIDCFIQEKIGALISGARTMMLSYQTHIIREVFCFCHITAHLASLHYKF
jgi:hypothetical protein